MKNIMIIGASGFIGEHLLKYYLNNSDNVCAVVRQPKKLEKYKECNNIEIVKADFEEYDKISCISKMRNIDILYYLAWGGYGKETNDYKAQIKNILPICNAVKSASNMGCKRFLFSTSFSEYMISEDEKLTHNQGASANVYGSAKHSARLMAHAVSKQENISFVSVAFANTFGVGDSSKRSTNLFLHKLLNNEALDLTDGKHLYDWNYIDDAISGLVLAGEKGKDDSVYYIGNNERKPLKDIVEKVRDIIAPNVEIRLGTYKENYHVDYSSVDVNKLYRDTGYRAKIDFDNAILKTAKWVENLKWD